MTLLKEEILQLLSSYIKFKDYNGVSNNLEGYCPFHKGGLEETPSFYVYVGPPRGDKQIPGAAFCHTCSKGWHLPGLLKALKVGYIKLDAIKSLLDREVRKKDPKLVFDTPILPERLLGMFDYAPKELLRAGFTKKTLKYFDVGFDKLQKRITFPIRDHHGNLVGMSGRTVVNSIPRYKIYRKEFEYFVPGYELKKQRVVWGLDKFYLTALGGGVHTPVVVCEGFKAAMWVYQHCLESVVCLLGVNCSREQAALISRVTNEVVLLLDNNEAGIQATDKLISVLGSSLSLKIARYPSTDNLQPDNLDTVQLSAAINGAYKPKEWKSKWQLDSNRRKPMRSLHNRKSGHLGNL